jgi:hypothetical protein
MFHESRVDSNICFFCVHAPKEDKSGVESAQFYEQLNRTYIQCPSYDIKIIMSDFNAKAGNGSWAKTIVGGHRLHD